jgi:hypothetical protein
VTRFVTTLTSGINLVSEIETGEARIIMKSHFRNSYELNIPDGEMQHFPDVGLGEVRHHLLGEDPVGHRGALDDLSLQQLVHQNDHHLQTKKGLF